MAPSLWPTLFYAWGLSLNLLGIYVGDVIAQQFLAFAAAPRHLLSQIGALILFSGLALPWLIPETLSGVDQPTLPPVAPEEKPDSAPDKAVPAREPPPGQ